MATKNIVPRAAHEGQLGTAAKPFLKVIADELVIGGVSAAPAIQSINPQTGRTYTLVLADAGKLITLGNAASIAVTIPINDSVAFPIGTHIDFVQILEGKVTFSGAGTVINSKLGCLSIAAQQVGATLVKTATNTWSLFGDLIA